MGGSHGLLITDKAQLGFTDDAKFPNMWREEGFKEGTGGINMWDVVARNEIMYDDYDSSSRGQTTSTSLTHNSWLMRVS